MKLCHKCVISGRVQGVFYRHGTQKQAEQLLVTGWVRNLPTGEVECLICGEEQAVLAMLAWLRKGPPVAKVEAVSVSEHPWEDHDRFEIIR